MNRLTPRRTLELSVGQSFSIDDYVITVLEVDDGDVRVLVERIAALTDDADDDDFRPREYRLSDRRW